MDKNITRDVAEENNATALETEKTIARLAVRFDLSAGWALNTLENISVATTMENSAVSIIHFSPFVLSSSCVSANKSYGVCPSPFFISLNAGLTTFSTSFHYKSWEISHKRLVSPETLKIICRNLCLKTRLKIL